VPVRVVAVVLSVLATAAEIAPEPVRVTAARTRVGDNVTRALEQAGVPRPRALLLRVFKEERLLEVWAAAEPGGPFVHLGDQPVCASSGGPGPKARTGDGQVPEGLYRVTSLNPWSRFHLSLRLDYPNAADRARNPGVAPGSLGGDIYVHGACVTIGCIPLGDEAIEEVYLAALDTRARGGVVQVLILPARPGGARWTALAAGSGPAVPLWRSLAEISTRFETSRRLPRVAVRSDGTYAPE
jgi:murein L,D-transpeptidase YafK